MTVVVRQVHVQAVLPETHVQTGFKGPGLLPQQCRSGQGGEEDGVVAVIIGLVAIGTIYLVIAHGVQTTVGTIGHTKFGEGNHILHRLHEGFLGEDPTGGDSGEESPAALLGQTGIAVITGNQGDQILGIVIIVGLGEEGQDTVLAMPGVNSTGFILLGETQVLEIVRVGAIAIGIKSLGPLVKILDTQHGGHIVNVGKGLVEIEDTGVGLIQIPVIIIIAFAVLVIAVGTQQIVLQEIFLLGVFIVPAGAGLEIEPRGEENREGLVHVELVRIVVVYALRVGNGHMTILDAVTRAGVPLTVGIGGTEGGRDGPGTVEVVGLRVAVLDGRPGGMGKVEGRTGMQPLPDLVVSVESEGDTVVVIV